MLPAAAGADGSKLKFTEWSAPVHQGAPVSSSALEIGARLSPNGLSLYITSDRDGGNLDIWVAQRDCVCGPWKEPVRLGPNINTPGIEFTPSLSPNGRMLFFASDGHDGGVDDTDIFVSYREDTSDDFAWGPPVKLNSFVNTVDHEQEPVFLPGKGHDGHTLYFVISSTTSDEQDIYQASVSRKGIPRGPATPVTELNAVGLLDGGPNPRRDGLEIFFWSARPGSLGNMSADVWTSTRPNVNAPWSPPVNLGTPVNTNFAEIGVNMTYDGRQMYITKGFQAGGLGLRDIWLSTREIIKDHDDDEEDDD
jgi:hypothetical protein